MIIRATQRKMISRAVTSDIGRVEGAQRGGLLGPAERRERPQRAREPGVEHVLVLAQRPAAGAAALGRRRARRRSPRRRRSSRPAAGGPTTAGARCTTAGCSPSSRGRRAAQRSGWKRTRPSRTASIAGARELVHAHEPLQRDQRLDARARSGASRGRRACSGSRPAQRALAPRARRRPPRAASATVEPGEALARRVGHPPVLADHRVAAARPWRRPISKSLGSWPGVTFSAPVPKSGLT